MPNDFTQRVTRVQQIDPNFSENDLLTWSLTDESGIAAYIIEGNQNNRKNTAISSMVHALDEIRQLNNCADVRGQLFEQLYSVFFPLLQKFFGDAVANLQIIINNPDYHRSESLSLFSTWSDLQDVVSDEEKLVYDYVDHEDRLEPLLSNYSPDVGRKAKNIMLGIDKFVDKFSEWYDCHDRLRQMRALL